MVIKQPTKAEESLASDISLGRFFLISIVVIAVQISVGLIIYFRFSNWGERANFGEMFGAVNTLFSGLAFAGVIYAVFLQRRELELQRYELKMTREELRRSAEAQEKSEQALSSQAALLAQTSRLNALNSLVEAYKGKLEQMRRDGVHQTNEEYRVKQAKYDHLFESLERVTEEIEETYIVERV